MTEGTQELTGLVGWVADVIDQLGALGVGLLVALENVFPPIPSEVVLPFAGFLAGQGRGDPWVMIAAATLGAASGAVVLYELGRRLGQDRVRAALTRLPLVAEDEVDRAVAWFERHGLAAVFTGRFVPLVRSLVSLPAGSSRVPRGRFILLTVLGSGVWNAAWVWAGFLLGERWRTVGRYSDLLNVILIVGVLALVARFVWRRRDRITDPSGRSG